MSIYVVIQQSGPNSHLLGESVKKAFGDAVYTLSNDVWLVAGAGTAADVSTRIGITPEGLGGSGIVIEAASYYGRANPAVWSWIKNNWEASPLG